MKSRLVIIVFINTSARVRVCARMCLLFRDKFLFFAREARENTDNVVFNVVFRFRYTYHLKVRTCFFHYML